MKKEKPKLQISPKLVKSYERQASLVCQTCAAIARNKLRYEYQLAIQKFYNSQEPDYYNRGFGLFNSFKPYYKNVRGKTYYGGIVITAERMKNDYNDPKDYVLSNAMLGQHGTSANQSDSPYEYILSVKNDIIKNQTKFVRGIRKTVAIPNNLRDILK